MRLLMDMVVSISVQFLNWICMIYAGVEARGFIFGPPIALAIGAKFVPLRKPKKLPGMFFCYINLLLSVLCR